MDNSHRFVLNHKILLDGRPRTHIWYRDDIREVENRNGLLDSLVICHCRLLEVISMVGVVYIVYEVAVYVFHSLQNLFCIRFAEFAVKMLTDIGLEQMFKLPAANFVALTDFLPMSRL